MGRIPNYEWKPEERYTKEVYSTLDIKVNKEQGIAMQFLNAPFGLFLKSKFDIYYISV